MWGDQPAPSLSPQLLTTGRSRAWSPRIHCSREQAGLPVQGARARATWSDQGSSHPEPGVGLGSPASRKVFLILTFEAPVLPRVLAAWTPSLEP